MSTTPTEALLPSLPTPDLFIDPVAGLYASHDIADDESLAEAHYRDAQDADTVWEHVAEESERPRSDR